jgi:spoIIIJ-associated protein
VGRVSVAYIVEKTGKSVEEAILLALDELQCARAEVEVEVVTEPSRGLWGLLGSKDAKVRVWKTEAQTEPAAVSAVREDGNGHPENPAIQVQEQIQEQAPTFAPEEDDRTAAFIQDVTQLMGIEAVIGKRETEEAVYYALNGPRMGTVIGRRGETLDALQYLTNIVTGRDREIQRKRIIVDAEDYRSRREETLVRLATRLATKAKRSGRRVVLEPMNPQERRVIHTALEKDPDVSSKSEGEDPYRRLVIYPLGGSRGYTDRPSNRWDDYDEDESQDGTDEG